MSRRKLIKSIASILVKCYTGLTKQIGGYKMSSRIKKLPSSYYKELVKKSEIKRIGENLTKRELTSIIGVHYNFYWNCVAGRNEVSENLAKALESYLNTPTSKVYETIFAMRVIGEKNKKVKRNDSGKEEYHESLEIDKAYEEKVLLEMKEKNVFKEPVIANMG